MPFIFIALKKQLLGSSQEPKLADEIILPLKTNERNERVSLGFCSVLKQRSKQALCFFWRNSCA